MYLLEQEGNQVLGSSLEGDIDNSGLRCGIGIDLYDERAGFLGHGGEAGGWIDDSGGSDDQQHVARLQRGAAACKVPGG